MNDQKPKKPEDRRHHDDENHYAGDHFERRGDDYTIISATTPELKKIFSQVRYHVFCEEHPEFSINYNINKTEMDVHDAHSVHFLLIYQPLHMVVGGIRIILPTTESHWHGLSSVQVESSPFRQDFPHDLSKMAEISRFMLIKERMRIAKAHRGEVLEDKNKPHPFRHLTRCVFKACADHHLNGFIASFEKALFVRSQSFFGTTLTKHGELFEHYGLRQGGYVVIGEYLDELKKTDPKSYHFFMEVMSN